MFKRKWYEWMLTIVYALMILLCIYLNKDLIRAWFAGEDINITTIVVNAILFVIVAIVFLMADFGSFAPMNAIIKDLNSATEKIRSDAMNSRSYLWEPYQSSNVKLFKNEKLSQLFTDFIFELNREDDAENAYYRPSIDDSINIDLVDSVMHRNELNQVPGLLTGLGILGTFIGLSIGLQHFNTGTTAQMTDSIEPLMNGIKVAFHTSIFGMVFSLAFNAIYKRKLYEGESAVQEFSQAFKKYVLPDTENNGMNQLISLQAEQLSAMDRMYTRVAEELGNIIDPHFDRLEKVVAEFETIMVRNETEAIRQIVDTFITEMNTSLGNSFYQLSESVNEQYKSQKANADMMTELLKTTGSGKDTLNNINNETERLVTTLNSYTASIQTIQNELQRTLSGLSGEDKAVRELLMQEKNMLLEQGNMIMEFKKSVSDIAKYSAETNQNMNEALEEITNGVDYMRKLTDKRNQAGGKDQ
ncbi:MAG: MotA/TolQ/ExbB proton channel family protein [Lachnospiraceae bacterium]|nr:MotA/TolQ/ExbB proton channel family protein [Lachnospiraceae bacterium]